MVKEDPFKPMPGGTLHVREQGSRAKLPLPGNAVPVPGCMCRPSAVAHRPQRNTSYDCNHHVCLVFLGFEQHFLKSLPELNVM